MSKSNVLENELLLLLFNGTALSGYGGNLFMALHSADPLDAGNQSTSEVSYTGYGRVSVPRDITGFTVSGGNVVNAADISFGTCTAGSATATHWSIGSSVSGSGKILYKGVISDGGLAISINVRPIFAAGSISITED